MLRIRSLRDLLLNLQIPVVDCRRAAGFSLNVGPGKRLAVELSWVKIGWSSKSRISRVDDKRWIETIRGVETGAGFISGIHRAAKVVVLQRAIENASAAPQDGLARCSHGGE